MKKLLVAAMFAFPLMAAVQNPFSGTWKTNLHKSSPSTRPIVFSVSNGMYDCTTCIPRVHVKADGSDQPVAGLSNVTIAVKEIDDRTIRTIVKRHGEVLSDQVRSASEDGHTLYVKVTIYPMKGKPVIEESTAERIGNPIPGANLASGTWTTQNIKLSDTGLVTTYDETATELRMSDPTGVSWVAKFDGKDYPVKGTAGVDSVVLRRLGGRTIEVSFKAKGSIVRINTITISADGKTMTTVSQSKLSGRTSTWIATKQEK